MATARPPPSAIAMVVGAAITAFLGGCMVGYAMSLNLLPVPSFLSAIASPAGYSPSSSASSSPTRARRRQGQPPPRAQTMAERYADEPESSEEEISEAEDLGGLDHAPNWANGAEEDRRDGLRAGADAGGKGTGKGKGKGTKKRAASGRDGEEEKRRSVKAAGGEKAAEAVKQEKEARVGEEAATTTKAQVQPADTGEECKLVLVVRTDLGMTKGKMAAQCSHATLACYKTATQTAAAKPFLRRWEALGQAKIAVQVNSEEQMELLFAKARSLGLVAEVIQDAGRTQIASGSRTVLGVGPAPRSLVDAVTGGLKLL